MSETSNLASNNIEPSMEDILSSIRKVIAEDLSQKEENEIQPKIKVALDVEHVAETVAEMDPQIEINPIDAIESAVTEQTELVDVTSADQQSAAQNPIADGSLEDILELDTLLGDIDEPDSDTGDLMELIQLEGSKEDTLTADEEFGTLPISSSNLPDPNNVFSSEPSAENPTEQTADFGFDETLDLVMDADASDYVTQSITPISSEPQDEQVDADFETAEVPQEPVQEAVQLSSSPEITPVNTNDDMDLVKSLLDDLMDEPISETVSEAISETVETAVAEASFDVEDAFSEEDLRIPDPEAVPIEGLVQASVPPTGEMSTVIEAEAGTLFNELENIEPENTELDDTETGNEVENELAQLAREIAEVRDVAVADTAPTDDVIELSTPNYASKLAISASLTGGSALVDNKSGGLIAAEAESDLESLQQLMAETDLEEVTPTTTNTPQEIDTLISPVQEDATMATPLKTDILSDADTQQEVGNAFASLTTTVQEHALAEENGPPIGELVKEALRPMLQEWLDKNLKGMVQRAVTKEIKRISSGK